MNRSHLLFFTYWTAVGLVTNADGFELIEHAPVGDTMLGLLRNNLTHHLSEAQDRSSTRKWPHLSGYAAKLIAQKWETRRQQKTHHRDAINKNTSCAGKQ